MALRIATNVGKLHLPGNDTSCVVTAKHMKSGLRAISGVRNSKTLFYFSFIRNPTKRALTAIFHFNFICGNMELSDENIIRELKNIAQFGGFQIGYLAQNDFEHRLIPPCGNAETKRIVN